VRAATAAIMDLARLGNRYYDAGRPWETRRTEPRAAGNTLHVCCRILRALATLSWPVIPGAAASLYRQLGQEDELVDQRWADAASEQPQLAGQRLGEVDILFAKLDDAFVARQRRKLQEAAAAPVTESSEEETMPEITYDDFARLDLRVGVVLAAERVPKTDKLLKLQVDLGGEPRQVLAGIAEWYEPAALVGKRIVVLVNLEPRKIRGEVSQGMLLAADHDGRAALLHPDADVPVGVRIR
jgi:methionyl-tRNA synthetase